MATVCDHLSVEELEERFVGCQDATLAAFPGDLAFGAGSHCFASIGNNSFRRAMDRTIACPLQCRRTRGSRRSTPPQRRNGNDPETRASGEAA